MLENKFEKNVQQEMQGFKIKPSEEVWIKVEERIREKKKRRIFFIIVLLGGLALLGYWQRDFLLNREKSNLAENPTMETRDKNFNTKNNQPVLETASQSEIITKTKDEKNQQKITKIETGNIPGKKYLPVAKKNKIKSKSGPSIDIVVSKTNKKEEVQRDTKLLNKIIEDQRVKETENKITNVAEKKNSTALISENKEKINTDNNVLPANEAKKDSMEMLVTAIENTDSSTIKKQQLSGHKHSSNSKWKWGVHFTPGISSVSENVFSFSKNKNMDLFSNPASPSGGPQAFPATPSAGKSGFAFQTGVSIQKQISERSSFILGMQYGYYSNQIRVGNSRDSLLRVLRSDNNKIFSASNPSRNYTNKFHFIELAFGFQYRLNKNKIKPITGNINLIAGRLISTNALVYDTLNGGIYYNRNSFVNKTQLSVSTGLMFSVINKAKVKWSIGPVADFHVNSLMNTPLGIRKYLVFAGLNSSFSFTGKK